MTMEGEFLRIVMDFRVTTADINRLLATNKDGL